MNFNKIILCLCLFLGVFMDFTSINTINEANTDKIYVNTHGNDSWNGLAPPHIN
jgi:hypothetical protein